MHTCTPDSRGSRAVPGLPCPAPVCFHLPSTCCGINPVDCCPREVGGGDGGWEWRDTPCRGLCLFYVQSKAVSLLRLSHTPAPRQSTELTHYPGCPLGRDTRPSLWLWFLFNVNRVQQAPQRPVLKTQPSRPPASHSLPLLTASFLVPALAAPTRSLRNPFRRSR